MDVMAARTRRSDPPVAEQLFTQPFEFDYFQSIRILAVLRPESKPFGESENPKDDPVQIQSRVGYEAPSSDIYNLFPSKFYDRPPIMTVNFLGIAGVQGPLPQPYTDLITERLRRKDTAFRDFLDIFNHRYASLWYRLEKKHIPGLEMVAVEETPIGKAILDLAGFADLDIENLLNIHSRSILACAPLFWKCQRSTAGLKKILETYFKIPIRVTELQGGWRRAPAEDWTAIGWTGRHQHLGWSTILGRRSWDQGSGIRVHLGTLSWGPYLEHMNGHHNEIFRSLIQLYLGLIVNFELRGNLKRAEIPPAYLRKGDQGGLRLGQTTWLTRGHGHGFEKDPEVLLMRER
jgi:type VI secretion system protein ImpH